MTRSGPSRPAPRFVVGIDLGTTNSALAWVELPPEGGAPARVETFDVAQLTAPGTVEARSLLPSFLFLPLDGEVAAGALRLPWGEPDEPGAVGTMAARRAAEMPDRGVSSAKSWLCHGGVDRTAAILPWAPPGSSAAAEAGARRVSPLAASAAYLAHLRDAWNHAMAADDESRRLENQDLYLTVPASFDAAARELTVRAAAEAGLERVHLLEEPQAALYAWVEASGDAWRERVRVGDAILVCDVGGGTTDLSLVTVAEEAGELALRRVAVGDHVLLGGDNMDLAIAVHLRERLARAGTRLDAWQFRGLILACRDAKETLLSETPPVSVPLVILGRGKKLIGGTIKTELTAADVRALLLDGFFPAVGASAAPEASPGEGLSELGLPYASDPAITRHLAAFVAAHGDSLRETAPGHDGRPALPTALLFNGGVMRASAIRARVSEVLAGWCAEAGVDPTRVLDGADLEHAVARGAATYGLARHGRGIRIRGGTARAYYVGVASAMPAVPGHPAPVKALCVVPFGVEEGSRLDVPGAEFGLLVGGTATFRFFASSLRRDDAPGVILDEWETGELEELSPLRVDLDGEEGGRIPVRLSAHVTEIGTLELWFAPAGAAPRWRLEFSVRAAGGSA